MERFTIVQYLAHYIAEHATPGCENHPLIDTIWFILVDQHNNRAQEYVERKPTRISAKVLVETK